MKANHSTIIRFWFASLFCTTGAWSASSNISVFTATGRGYRTPEKPVLMEKPITYAISFAKASELSSDEQISTATFATALAETLVKNLSLQGFELATEAEEAEQLLIVHAGTTQVPSNLVNRSALQYLDLGSRSLGSIPGFQYFDREENQLWVHNMRILGYSDAYEAQSVLNGMTFQQLNRQDLANDLRRPRNYLVVSAYDFKAMQTQKNPPLLWRTHINVESGPIPFASQVDTLVSQASKYFGRRTPRLIRRFNTEVHIGPIEVVEKDAP